MKKKIRVKDKMQNGYEYEIKAPMGRKFDANFKPELSPKQMLELGVFGGKYMTDCRKEFPSDWFEKSKLNSNFHDPKLNFFAVNASQPLSIWKKKGWIWEGDPRGWFQWYCRYYMGRRCPDDARQIKRWKAFRRHYSAVEKNCVKQDLNCRKKQRQALLHWSYDSRKI